MSDQSLTKHQIEILASWWRHSGRIRPVANDMKLSPQTIKNTLVSMREKTGQTNTAMIRAYRNEISEYGDQPRLTPRRIRYQVDTEWANRQRELAREGMRKIRAVNAARRAAAYQELIVAQNGKCAICGKHESEQVLRRGGIRRLALDHDHATEAIRGLLCGSCNIMLGTAGDSPEKLEAGARYLRGHAQRKSHNSNEAA